MSNIFANFRYSEGNATGEPTKKVHTSICKAAATSRKVFDPSQAVEKLRYFKQTSRLMTSVDDFQKFFAEIKISQNENFPFCVLCAGILGTQTHDSVAIKATRVLIEACGGQLSAAALIKFSQQEITELIKFCNFFNNKGKYIFGLAQILFSKPVVLADFKYLTSLPGVGPKIANLTLDVAFDRPHDGLVVDTHVHRLSARIGWTTSAANPEQTRHALEALCPNTIWSELTLLLINLGQSLCLSQPKCNLCPLRDGCLYSSMGNKKFKADDGHMLLEYEEERNESFAAVSSVEKVGEQGARLDVEVILKKRKQDAK